MSTWAKMQKTIDDLRAELNSVQVTTAKLDSALAERADKARKYTSANGPVEMNFDTGEFKLAGFALGSLPSAQQMITVSVSEWSESDVPANAKARLAFMTEQIDKVPAEYRADAEFSTEDFSVDRDGSDIRTTLTYRRLETDREAAKRVARQAESGVTISADGVTITANGKVMVRLCRFKDDEQPAEQPFAVEGDQVFISQALIDPAMWRVKGKLDSRGQYVAGGIGLGIDPTQSETKDGQTDLERAIEKGDAAEILRLLSSAISEIKLGRDLHDEIAKTHQASVESIAQRLDQLAMDILTEKFEDDAAKTLVEQRLAAMEALLDEKGAAEAAQDAAMIKAHNSIKGALVSSVFIDPGKFKIADPAAAIRQVIREELRPGGMLHRG